jgi:Collagen triple helix repeat (20 copies)
MSAPNKYTVHTRLTMLENAATELRREISAIQLKEGKPGVRGCDGARGLKGDPGRDGRDGKDGKDAVGVRGADGMQGPRGMQGSRGSQGDKGDKGDAGQSIVGPKGDKGDKGEKGDITVYGDAELHEAVLVARKALIEQRARFLAAIAQAEHDARGDSSTHRIIRGRIEQLRREAGL